MTEATKKKFIFHIAKELNISHNDIIDFLKNEGIAVKNHMTPVDFDVYAKILTEFSKEKQQIERHRKEQARKAVVKKKIATTKPQPRKIKTSLQDGKLSLSDKLKSAKDKLEKDKENASLINKATEQKNETVKSETAKTVEDSSKATKISTKEKVTVGLKVLRKATDEEKASLKLQKEKELERKNRKREEKLKPKENKKSTVDKIEPKIIPKPRKLKKIDVAAIADKINQSKKGKKKGNVKVAPASLKQPLPSFGKKLKKKPKKKSVITDEQVTEVKNIIKVPEFTSVDELAQSMNVKVQEVIMVCMNLGLMVTINQRLDMETIIMVADEFNFEVKTLKDFAEEITQVVDSEEDLKNATPRPPVVTIMGHVDHGKTSLLDYVRKTNVIAGEAGGITQHIGAYEVVLGNGKKITFIDTPGHAAFTAMRARGAQVTDLVIIIVAADDGVMPQTIEALDHAQAAGVPIVIAINKVDRPQADAEKIRKELSEKNFLVEDWGGKYQSAEISAKTGAGIDELMEKVLLEADMLDLKANKDTLAKGVVVESKLDKGRGSIATVLIQKGTLRLGDVFVCGTQCSKVRAMLNERNVKIKEAFPADPVQILGFSDVPNAGEVFTVFEEEREAKKIALERSQLKREAEQRRFRKLTLDQIGKQISAGALQELDIIIKGDVDGSIEALSDSLMGLSTEEVSIKILHRSVGMITENDVTLASASNAIIVAFNVNSSTDARTLAKTLGIDIRHYSIIYEAINEIKLALEGLLEPERIETPIGYAEARMKFKVPKLGVIAGCYITKGKVIRNALLRVRRGDEILHEGKLTSLKRFKEDVAEVAEGYECGIGVQGFNDFEDKDIIEVYEVKEIKRTLS